MRKGQGKMELIIIELVSLMILLSGSQASLLRPSWASVAKWCSENHFSPLTLIPNDASVPNSANSALLQALNSQNVLFRVSKPGSIGTKATEHHLVLANSNLVLNNFLALSKQMNKFTMIIACYDECVFQREKVILKHNALVYVINFRDGMQVHAMMATPRFNRPILVDVTYTTFNRHLREKGIDLEGQVVGAGAITSSPYITITNCNELNTECKMGGIIAEMLNLLTLRFNFTIEASTNRVWTDNSATCSTNLSMTLGLCGGIFGDVVQERVDISPADWLLTPVRQGMLDGVPLFVDGMTLMMASEDPSAHNDLLFLLRPFSPSSWLVILLTSTLLILFMMASKKYFKKNCGNNSLSKNTINNKIDEFSDASRLIETSCWLCFLLVNSFYSGALTMFLTSDFEPPFNSFSSAINAYPEWTVRALKTNNLLIKEMALSKHSTFEWQVFYERMLNENQGYFEDIHAALNNMLMEKHTVLYARHIEVSALHFNNKKYHGLVLNRFAPEIDWLYLLITKNSPLFEIFDAGLKHLRLVGSIKRIMTEHGVDVHMNKDNVQTTQTLGVGHLLVGFTLVIISSVMAMLVLMAEIVFYKRRREPQGTHNIHD